MTKFFDYIAANAWKVILPVMAVGAMAAFIAMLWFGLIPGPVEMFMTIAVLTAIVWTTSSAWNFVPEKIKEPKLPDEGKL